MGANSPASVDQTLVGGPTIQRFVQYPDLDRPNRVDHNKIVSNEIIGLYSTSGITNWKIFSDDTHISEAELCLHLRPFDFRISFYRQSPFQFIEALASASSDFGVIIYGTFEHAVSPPIQAITNGFKYILPPQEVPSFVEEPPMVSQSGEVFIVAERPGRVSVFRPPINASKHKLNHSHMPVGRLVWTFASALFPRQSVAQLGVRAHTLGENSNNSPIGNANKCLSTAAAQIERVIAADLSAHFESWSSLKVYIGTASVELASMFRVILVHQCPKLADVAWIHADALYGRNAVSNLLRFVCHDGGALGGANLFIELDYFPFVQLVTKCNP